MYISATTMKNGTAVSQKIKMGLPYDPAVSLLVYTPKNWKQGFEVMFVHPCSYKHYSQKPRGGSNPMWPLSDEWISKIWNIHTMEYHSSLLVQFSSVAQFCYPMDCSTPGFSFHHQLPELAQTHVLWVDDAIQPTYPLSSPSPPAFNLPQLQGLSKESVLCIRWPEWWSFTFSISPSNEYSRLISFRIDWLDLLAVQGTLKSLLQHHSSKASILWCSTFFMVQLSHQYMSYWKNHSFD